MPEEDDTDQQASEMAQQPQEATGPKKVDERRKDQVRRDKEQTAERPEGKTADQHRWQAPQPSFAVLINSVATQAFVSLGEVDNPLSGKKEIDLPGAKFAIDLLRLLAEKTRGNLAPPEDRYLQGVLHELRMRYVDAAKRTHGKA